MLGALSVSSTLGPLCALMGTYLQACGRSTLVMLVQLVGVLAVVGSVGTIGRLGPLWTCAALGLAATVHLLCSALAVRAAGGPRLLALLATQVRPLLACIPMVGAVLGARWLMARSGLHGGHVALVVEIAAGAVAYCGASLVVARSTASELLRLVGSAFLGRRAAAPAPVIRADANVEV
jgi:hypothetical protein